MVGDVLSVIVTIDDVEYTDETAEVTGLTAEVTIADVDGFQLDGTALSGDTLTIVYGSDMGTPQNVAWYGNDLLLQSRDFTGVASNLNLVTGIDEGSMEVYAVVTTTDGARIKTTNTVTVTSTELPVEVSDFEILDDYDTPTLSYAAADGKAVIQLTTSKKVAGDLYIYKDTVAKFGTENAFAKIIDTNFTKASQITNSANLTAKEAIATDADTGDLPGIYYKNGDGSVTYLIVVNGNDFDGTKFSPIRGTSYKAVWDQKNIGGDDITGTTRDDVEVTESFVAPYLVAPASAELTTHTPNAAPKITLYDADEEVLTWMGTTTETTPAALTDLDKYGISSLITYDEKGASKAKAHKTTHGVATGNSAIKAGVVTGDQTLGTDTTYSYFWGAIKFKKGIFGASAIELETELVAGSEAPVSVMNLVDKSGEPGTAVVTFTKLRTAGTVYIVKNQTNTDAAAADIYASLDKDDPSTYMAKAEVAKGATKVELKDAIESYTESVDGKVAGNKYIAVFVPEDDSDYVDFYPRTFANKKYKVDDAEVSSNLLLTQVPTSVSFNADSTTGRTLTADHVITIGDTTTGNLVAKDQFGDTVVSASTDNEATSVEVINKDITHNEQASAVYDIAATGDLTLKVTVNNVDAQADNYHVDKKDGFKVTVLGSVFEITQTILSTVDTDAVVANEPWTVKVGSDTLCKPTAAAVTAGAKTDAEAAIDDATTALALATTVAGSQAYVAALDKADAAIKAYTDSDDTALATDLNDYTGTYDGYRTAYNAAKAAIGTNAKPGTLGLKAAVASNYPATPGTTTFTAWETALKGAFGTAATGCNCGWGTSSFTKAGAAATGADTTTDASGKSNTITYTVVVSNDGYAAEFTDTVTHTNA